MIESQFTTALRKKLIPHLYPLKLNCSFTNGVPDCWYSGSNYDLWNEHKFFQTLPPIIRLSDHTQKGSLTMLQQTWLDDRYEEGRRVAVIVGWMHEDGRARCFKLDDIDFYDNLTKLQAIEMSMTIKDMAEKLIEEIGRKVVTVL